jgi:MFS family permease
MAVLDEKNDMTALGTHHEDVSTDKSAEGSDINGPPVQEEEVEDDFEWSVGVMTNLASLLWCYFCSTWGLVVPNSAIGFITEQFPEGASKAAWIAAAVTIPKCVIQAFIGDLSDRLGRRIFLQAGCVFGLVGMIVASGGNSIEMVIAGQVLNGVGLTLGFLAVPLVAEIVPKNARALRQQAQQPCSLVSPTQLGPVFRGHLFRATSAVTSMDGGQGSIWEPPSTVLAWFLSPCSIGRAPGQILRASQLCRGFYGSTGLASSLLLLASPSSWLGCSMAGTSMPGHLPRCCRA